VTSVEELADWWNLSSWWQDLDQEDPIIEVEYLAFAELDLEEGNDSRRAINAISNAKRALHLRTDKLAGVLGGYCGLLKPKDPFPAKLKFLRECGIASPRIIERLNAARNKIEHEYINPTFREAEDYVDIVSLFLGASGRLARQWPTSAEAEPSCKTEWIQMSCEPATGLLTVDRFIRNLPDGRGSRGDQLVVSVGRDATFPRWMEQYLRLAE
jgi:hypothetical protein